jgi:hypothetical protein
MAPTFILKARKGTIFSETEKKTKYVCTYVYMYICLLKQSSFEQTTLKKHSINYILYPVIFYNHIQGKSVLLFYIPNQLLLFNTISFLFRSKRATFFCARRERKSVAHKGMCENLHKVALFSEWYDWYDEIATKSRFFIFYNSSSRANTQKRFCTLDFISTKMAVKNGDVFHFSLSLSSFPSFLSFKTVTFA